MGKCYFNSQVSHNLYLISRWSGAGIYATWCRCRGHFHALVTISLRWSDRLTVHQYTNTMLVLTQTVICLHYRYFGQTELRARKRWVINQSREVSLVFISIFIKLAQHIPYNLARTNSIVFSVKGDTIMIVTTGGER